MKSNLTNHHSESDEHRLMMDQLVDRLASKKFVDQLVDRFVLKI